MIEPCNVLLSSAGRRVALLRAIQADITALGVAGRVVAVDASPLAAAVREADSSYRVPNCASAEFVPALLKICRDEDIRLVVPTIDPELPVWAEHRDEFGAIGTRVAVSSPETIAITGDKQRTHDWLQANEFPTVRQGLVREVIAAVEEWNFPLVVKPRHGSASVGVTVVHDRDELDVASRGRDVVVQSAAVGDEYTLDVYIDKEGRAPCVVPRRRLEVRAGEVSKAVTVRCPPLEHLGRYVAEALPGAYGPITVQVFADERLETLQVIEVNPRFGGGFPLTWEAGARFPRWLMEDLADDAPTDRADVWRSGLVMLRYDDAVFVDADDVGE